MERSSTDSALASRLGTNARPATRQNSGNSQFVAAIKSAASEQGQTVTRLATTTSPTILRTSATSSSSTSSTTSTSSSTTSTSDEPTMLGMGPVAGTAPVQESAPSATSSASTPQLTEAQAYWAAQPAAVQALQNLPVGPERDQLASQLAAQGYSIDNQIMVLGWDPQMTMTIRQNEGYTWVPAYGQGDIPVGAGISDPYDTDTYNADAPPAGSIQVSTAFDQGTILNPLVQTNSTST